MESRDSALNLVVNCTARKVSYAGQSLSLGDFENLDLPQRADLWTTSLDSRSGNRVRASNLYCGDYWSTIRGAYEHGLQNQSISLFIASAGYGLLREDEQVLPYSATFSRGKHDSVGTQNDSRRSSMAWWKSLKGWRRSTDKFPASIADLAKVEADKPLLVCVSAEYFHALSTDLAEAREVLSSPDLLMIISSGIKNAGLLAPNLIPTDARIEHSLCGVRSSLNARIVRYILSNISQDDLRASRLSPIIKRLLDEQPPIRKFNREKLNDETVVQFITQQLAVTPQTSFTTLLRALRASGHACEYKRFRGLYHEIKKTTLKAAITS